jgi:hypothetical protein
MDEAVKAALLSETKIFPMTIGTLVVATLAAGR